MPCGSFPSLYKTVLYSLVKEWKHFKTEDLNSLPGSVKEDLLSTFLAHRKGQEHISGLLHPDIRKLDLSEGRITSHDLESIASCVHIMILDISPPRFQWFDHPSSSLEKLFSRLPQLTKLRLQRNNGVIDKVISVLTTNCPLLQVLDVTCCIKLTDEAATSLATLANIRALGLTNTLVSDAGLTVLSKGVCSVSLSELNLNNCVQISDVGIHSIVKGCKNLSILNFNGCPKVSVDCQLSIYDNLEKDKKKRIVSWTIYI